MRQTNSNRGRQHRKTAKMGEEENVGGGTCWLCQRQLGSRIEWHHPVPRSRGGRCTVALHPLCHRTLHANFANARLARIGEDRAALRAEPAIAKFLDWIAAKPPDFHAPTRRKR